ncbi:hypothetical protein LXL04_009892 [Taraxacum kok-saghyz]
MEVDERLARKKRKKYGNIFCDYAKKVCAHNQYNHRLSRKGYAGLTIEIMQETGKAEEEIERCMLWKRARQRKKRSVPFSQFCGNVTYTDAELDMVRTEWCSYITNFVY